MNLAVDTGITRERKGSHLYAKSFLSHQKEQAVFLMEVEGKEGGAESIVEEAESIVQHALLESEGEAGARLDGTLKEMNGLIKGMLAAQAVKDIHMILCIVDREGTLHASHAGRAEGYLVRGGIASQITEYEGKPTPAFVHIASGQLEGGDSVIFSTQRLLRTCTPAQLASMTQKGDEALAVLTHAITSEGEQAALAVMSAPMSKQVDRAAVLPARRAPPSRRRPGSGGSWLDRLPSMESIKGLMPSASAVDKMKGRLQQTARGSVKGGKSVAGWAGSVQQGFQNLLKDMKDPGRRKRAHFLLLATAAGIVVVLWAGVHLLTANQRNRTKAELEELVAGIEQQMQTAENRRVMGDIAAANAILQQAEAQAKQVMDNESGLFRVEALELIEQIERKYDSINNISRVRLSDPFADLSGQNPDILAQGIIGVGEREFTVFDKQNVFRVLLSSVQSPVKLTEDTLLVDGTFFDRFQTQVFLTTGNGMMEWNGSQPSAAKTADEAGWKSGTAIATYLRYIYMLSPADNQIYKYERQGNSYGAPAPYNVNGDLEGALDLAIDGNIYVLMQDGTILKLLRGEKQPFTLLKAPEGVLKGSARIFKRDDSRFYVLDPVGKRVIVLVQGEQDSELVYLRQYLLEGETLRDLKDLYVDEDEAVLYVLDDKRVYAIDLVRE